MPLVRYFIFVGGVLLALLFIADAYLPRLPATERTAAAADLSVIRIYSDRKWPERVVFDTTLPTVTPPTSAITETRVPPPPSIADAAPKAGVHEAFAQLPSNPNQLQPTDPRKQEAKRKRKAVAKSYTAPPTILVAQQPRFGFFGNNIW
jgi:hypothetical protein